MDSSTYKPSRAAQFAGTPLFDPPGLPIPHAPAHRHDVETAVEEGKRRAARGLHVGIAKAVLAKLQASGPMTRRELKEALGLSDMCLITAPVNALVKAGECVETGAKRNGGMLVRAA